MVSQNVPQLRPAAAAAEAPARAGGGAGLQRLALRAQAGPRGAAAPGRCEPADGGRAPSGTSAALRARRAQGRRTRSGRSCRAVTHKEMKTLLSHGFNQRPRFEQVVGYLERNEPLPLDQPDRKATTFVTSHFYLDDFVQSSEDPNPQPLQHTPLRGRPGRRPRGRRADEQRPGPALHHGPSAQRGRRSAGSSGPGGRRSPRARGGAGLPLPAPPGRC